jgi:hypothetical protein
VSEGAIGDALGAGGVVEGLGDVDAVGEVLGREVLDHRGGFAALVHCPSEGASGAAIASASKQERGYLDPAAQRTVLIVHSDSQGAWPDASACASTEQCRDRPDRSSRPDLRQASVGRRLGATATATCRRSARPAPPTMAFAPAWRVAVPVGGKSDLAPQRRDGRSGMIWA